MFRGEHIVKNRHGFPETDILESSGNPELGDLIRSRRNRLYREIFIAEESLIVLLHFSGRMVGHDRLFFERNDTIGRLVHSRNAVKGCSFPRAVGAD